MSQTTEGPWPVFSSVGGILPIAWTKLTKDVYIKLSLRFLSEVEYLILQVSGCHWSKLADLSTRLEDSRDVMQSLTSAAKILPVSPDKSWLICYKTDSWISMLLQFRGYQSSATHTAIHTPLLLGSKQWEKRHWFWDSLFFHHFLTRTHKSPWMSLVLCSSGRKGGMRTPSLGVSLWLEPLHLCVVGNEIV